MGTQSTSIPLFLDSKHKVSATQHILVAHHCAHKHTMYNQKALTMAKILVKNQVFTIL